MSSKKKTRKKVSKPMSAKVAGGVLFAWMILGIFVSISNSYAALIVGASAVVLSGFALFVFEKYRGIAALPKWMRFAGTLMVVWAWSMVPGGFIDLFRQAPAYLTISGIVLSAGGTIGCVLWSGRLEIKKAFGIKKVIAKANP